LFKTVISGVSSCASFSFKAFLTWVTGLTTSLNLECVIWADNTSYSSFGTSFTSWADFETSVSRLDSDGSLCGVTLLAWCALSSAGCILVCVLCAILTSGTFSCSLSNSTDF